MLSARTWPKEEDPFQEGEPSWRGAWDQMNRRKPHLGMAIINRHISVEVVWVHRWTRWQVQEDTAVFRYICTPQTRVSRGAARHQCCVGNKNLEDRKEGYILHISLKNWWLNPKVSHQHVKCSVCGQVYEKSHQILLELSEAKSLVVDDIKYSINVVIHQQLVKNYVNRESGLRSNLNNIYGLLWGQCSHGINSIIHNN